MTRINIYDTDGEKLERIANNLDISIAELISRILDMANDIEIEEAIS